MRLLKGWAVFSGVGQGGGRGRGGNETLEPGLFLRAAGERKLVAALVFEMSAKH